MQNPLSGQEFGKYKYDFGKVMPATVQTPQAGGITRPWPDLAVKLPASLKLTGSSELSVLTKLLKDKKLFPSLILRDYSYLWAYQHNSLWSSGPCNNYLK